ncbi:MULTISPECIES: DoxX family protein [unclassified Arenibacter]|jgi:putative oxidoreductase|uniref:DoxX family protein n=1 Tax=unclassified Arenibacter TaxID=2615047 RepID=UPI000E34AA08|nr:MULTISPECIES: DoxX family protein [unclassified Arenibacter]MCM4162867.1 DoxX family protein [Arenibacter sp. A80]RFT56919.1 DoxX family protein [Arenibacter sp. P308M17]
MKDLGLLFLRISSSILILTHGLPKLQNLLGGNFEFGDPIGIGATPSLFLAVIGEFICPILVIVGFKTRWATVPTIITMLVAALIVHGADPFPVKEKAVLFLTAFISVLMLGPGKYSLDRK